MANERVRRSIEFQFGVDLGSTDNSIAGLERQLEKLQEEFKNTEIGTARFKELGAQIQQTQSQLKTLDERFEGLGAEQKATAIADSFNVLVGSVGAVTGALVAFGVESEALENVEKRLLGIITVVTSLREVSNGLQSFVKIWPLLTANIAKATAAVRAFALANPFTAIAAGVVALTVAIVALVKSQDDEEESLAKLEKAREDYEKQLDAESDARIRLLKAQGASNEAIQEEIILSAKRAKQKAEDRFTEAQIENRFSQETQDAREALNKATTDLQVAEEELATIQRNAREREADASKKAAADRKKEAEDKKKAAEDELKRLEELRVARLAAAQAGAEGLLEIETDLTNEIRKRRQEQIEEGLDAFNFFVIDEETLELVKQDLIENESLIRALRLSELDKTTADLLKRNEEFFAKSIEGLEMGSTEYLAAEKQFQANRTTILQVDSEERRKITNNEMEGIFNANFKLAKMLNELAKAEGAKLLEIEDGTYKERKQTIIDYYDAIIAAARAAGLAVVELERQKNAAIKNLDDNRRKDVEDGIRSTLSTFSSFLSQQRDIIDSQLQQDLIALGNNEAAKNVLRQKAFEEQKKLRIAEAAISGISGAVDAFTSVQSLNKVFPGLGIAVGLGLAASVLAITGKQIDLIASSTLGGANVSGGGFNNVPSGGFSIPTTGVPITGGGGASLPGLGGGRLAGAPTIGTLGQEPLRAYVLAGDVTNGVQANIALNNRRRLAG